MTEASKVRVATPGDEEGLMALCRLLHAENGLFPMDEDLVREMLWRAFDRQGGTIGVIGPRDALQGMIAIMISRFWYSKQPYLEELFNFVHPEHRRSAHAKALIAFSRRCADEIGIPLLIGVVSNLRTEAKVKLYERQLGKPAGAFFLYPNQPQGVH